MANVQQTQKMIPFITCEVFPWSVCLRVGSWCQCIRFAFCGPELVRSKNQSRSTLWVLETCLMLGLPPYDDHVDHSFVVVKNIKRCSHARNASARCRKIVIIAKKVVSNLFLVFALFETLLQVHPELMVLTRQSLSRKLNAGILSISVTGI